MLTLSLDINLLNVLVNFSQAFFELLRFKLEIILQICELLNFLADFPLTISNATVVHHISLVFSIRIQLPTL